MRVLAIAERPDGDEEEDEEDYWYNGAALDGSRQGQFPASLVIPIDSNEVEGGNQSMLEPNAKVPEPAPTGLTMAPAGLSSEEKAIDPSVPLDTPEQPAMELQRDQTAYPVNESSQSEIPMENEKKGDHVATDDAIRPEQSPVAFAHTSTPVHSGTEGSEMKSVNPNSEITDGNTKATSSEGATSTKALLDEERTTSTAAPSTKDTDVPDPSRLSLRERIAAFNKPADKGPPPIPRGKPGGWKRPPPPENGQKPPMPTDKESRAAAAPRATQPLGEPVRNDAPGSFSASDAKSSIKLSLKERMAALQRSDAEAKPPAPAPTRKLSRDVERDAPAEEEPDEDEAARRAAIAQRMARMGGQRMGPFGGVAKAQPETIPAAKPSEPLETALDDAAGPTDAGAESAEPATEVPVPKAETAESDAPETLVFPRRTAAPRTRRAKATPPEVPTSIETEEPKDVSNNAGPSDNVETPSSAQEPATNNEFEQYHQTPRSTSQVSPSEEPVVSKVTSVGASAAPLHAQEPMMPRGTDAQVPAVSPSQAESMPGVLQEPAAEQAPQVPAEDVQGMPVPTAYREVARPELPSEMSDGSELGAASVPAQEAPRSVPPSPAAQPEIATEEQADVDPSAQNVPELKSMPQQSADEHQAGKTETARSEVPGAFPTQEPAVFAVPEQADSGNMESPVRLESIIATSVQPPTPGEEMQHFVPDSTPIVRAVPPFRSAPPPPMASSQREDVPEAIPTQGEASSSSNPVVAGTDSSEADDFASHRHQLEQLLDSDQGTSELPYTQERAIDNKQDTAEPAFARVTKVSPDEGRVPEHADRNGQEALPVPPLDLGPKDSLGLPQGPGLSRADSLTSDKTSPAAPVFMPSPSDVSFPTFVSPNLPPQDDLPTVSEEDVEQERRAQIAQRMAKLGGQRIAGMPGMPVPPRQSTQPPMPVNESIPPPQTPSAQPEAPVLPQEPTLPEVSAVATPEVTPAVHPQRPARRAPTLPAEANVASNAPESDELRSPPGRAPPSRPPPSRVPPPPGSMQAPYDGQ